MDFVVERKRIDDLVGSIKDGRWSEQKFRLKASGVRNRVYLIEGFRHQNATKDCFGIPYQALNQAIVDAQVVDGFDIKHTDNNGDTINYLVTMTRYMQSYLTQRTLYSCTRQQIVDNEVSRSHFMTYSEFERTSKKVTNFTAKEMFIKHLLQFRGLALDTALAITDLYPTLATLRDAYEICETEKQKIQLLMDIDVGSNGRRLGPAISRKIYLFYGQA
jgi:crossover junction endonuclease MUS81